MAWPDRKLQRFKKKRTADETCVCGMERKTGVRSKPGARSKQPRDGWARGRARVDGLGAARVWNSYFIPRVLNSGVLYIYI